MKHWQDASSTHIETGKMPVLRTLKLARCQFYQDASYTQDQIHETGKMPVLPKLKLARCQFYQDASLAIAFKTS
ncbi:hypothetical protein [Moorena sp. SIO4G3]|uniref:hypothetical protein n=1 Tax=Moorena sp. SIO4G3 TaxID=2607821 RepID=UPI00142A43B8|nr:hypothetical protein [Moorena sp. SIO4G3]NEO74833.1 hypothetical protein [Moorena sp. SIO4G3]